jgi:ragB/susD domain protein
MKNLVFILACCVGILGCGDFLKEQSKEYVYATSCSDLDEVLIGSVYMNNVRSVYNVTSRGNDNFYPWLHVMDDDASEYCYTSYNNPLSKTGSPVGVLRPFHGWYREPFVNENGSFVNDATWIWFYKAINNANVVVDQVDGFTADPEDIRRRVKGEALFLRGAYYFLLSNIYAKPYAKATAEQDLGVPLKLTEYVEDKYYGRPSNEVVYQQIVKDLSAAAINLAGIEQKNIYRVNEYAVRVLLSRVYLYMGEWQLALDECNKVIEVCHLWNLNNYKVEGDDTQRDFVISKDSPEVLFTQAGYSILNMVMESGNVIPDWSYRASDELMELYHRFEGEGVTDLRAKAYFKELTGRRAGTFLARKLPAKAGLATAWETYVLRAAEVFLNKAEAEAMLDKAEAKMTLTDFLRSRFAQGNIPDLTALSGESLVKFIREERRREFCFECHRWFDLRRYAVSSKYAETKVIEHKMYAEGIMPAQIKKSLFMNMDGSDAAWVMPIPDFELNFNKGELQPNDERSDRRTEFEYE